MTFLDRLNSPKFDFTQNWSGSKINKFEVKPISHFENFWSLVQYLRNYAFVDNFG